MGNPITNGNGHSTGPDDRLPEPIAIVGAACRLPGEASSLRGLWDMMQNSRTAHARVPKERWNADAWYHPDSDRKGSLNTTHGFFIEQDVAAFDAPFFSVTAKEAAGMDPAKRLLLEVAYESFENAGLSIEQVAGSMTGVYVGSMTSDYEVLSTHEIYDEPHMAAAGSSEAMTANRVSWFFDLRGPSLTLDTACSSSLYALHLACQSLRLRETNMALVAGVNVILHPNFMHQLVAMHMLSPDGISHTFDDRANGYGRGEGIGSLIIKRLSDAIRDGDTIRAVIRGTGVNVDGKTPSVTMPSSDAQADLIRAVHQEAGLPLDRTRYVELHGTGTPVGDPIELSAIASTFGTCGTPDEPVYVGSIKPNVGHTEGCAGLAGVFKAMMCLENGIILPTAEVKKINPKLRFSDWNLALADRPIPWPAQGLRRISVNSFGFGGANAHLILDDAYNYMRERGLKGKHATVALPESTGPPSGPNGHPAETEEKTSLVNGLDNTSGKNLYVFSARDEPGIARLAKSLESYWKSASSVNIGSRQYASNVAFTLASRRTIFDYRSFAVASSISELSQVLGKPIPRSKRSSKQHGVAFVFTGQGAQWAGMGRQLVERPVFAASIKRSQACLATLSCPFDLEVELAKTEDSKIGTPEYSQPICTAVQVALVDLLESWGVKPKAVVGHSSGEIAAAYAAGILTHEDAIKVAYLRGVYSGKVSSGTRTGAMLAAGISQAEADEYLEDVPKDSVVVACVNSPKSVTLSGDAEYVDQLEKSINRDSKFARKLRVTTAYHSPHMRDVADDCLEAMAKAGVGESRQVPSNTFMFSSVTGQLIDPVEVDNKYWLRNMCGTVRFSEAVHSLLTHSSGRRGTRKAAVNWSALVEVGPHSALKAPLVQIMEAINSKLPTELPYTSMLQRGEDAVSTSLKSAGHLWAFGIPISLESVNQESTMKDSLQVVVDLPAYPWNHEKTYWHESIATKEQRLQNKARTDLLGIAVENQNPFEPEWRNSLRVRENPWMEDHKITGTTLYPGAGMLIMVIEAVQDIAAKDKKVKGVEFKDVHFERGLVIPGEGATETRLRIHVPTTSDSSDHTFAVFSRIGEGSWTKHCFGSFAIVYVNTDDETTSDLETFEWKTYTQRYEEMKSLSSKDVDVKKLYKSLHGVGMQYGPTFQNLTSLIASPEDGFCHGTIAIPDTRSVMPHEYEFPHTIHPATLDAIFHLIVVAVANGTTMTEAAVPMMLEKLFISFDLPQGAGALFSGYSERVDRQDKQLAADLVVSDDSWSEPKIIVKGLLMRQVTSGTSDTLGSGTLDNTASHEKVTKIVWKRDPDSVLRRALAFAPKDIEIVQLRDWLDLECHKSASLQVLLDISSLDEDVFGDIEPFINDISAYRGFSRITVAGESEEALQHWKSLTAKSNKSLNFISLLDVLDEEHSQPQFDLVISGYGAAQENTAEKLAKFQSTLRPNGRIFVFKEHGAEQHVNGAETSLAAVTASGIPSGSKIDIYFQPLLQDEYPKEVCLLVPSTDDSSIPRPLLDTLGNVFRGIGIPTRMVELKDVDSLKNQHVVSLLDNSFVTNWTSTQFEQFQVLVNSAAHIFWITHGAQMLDPSENGLQDAPVTGLLRVLRNEFPQVTLAHLDLSRAFDPETESARQLLTDAWRSSITGPADDRDLEMAELNGEILVPRVVTETSMGLEVALTEGSSAPVLRSLSTSPPLRLIPSRAARQEVAWEIDDEAQTDLDPDYVEIRALDISVSKDGFSSLETLGNQVTGTVVRCGANVSRFAEGDRVVAFGARGCKTHVRQHHTMICKLGSQVPFEVSAASLWTYMIAIYVLKRVGRVGKDETILIQGGASILGQALLHVAPVLGISNIFATVQTQDQKVDLVKRLGLTDESILVASKRQDSGRLAAYLTRKTNSRGVDVVVCTASELVISGDLTGCLSDFARVVALLDATQPSSQAPALMLRGNISLSTVDPQHIMRQCPGIIAKLLADDLPGFLEEYNGSLLQLTPMTRFALPELSGALKWLHQPEQNGIVSIQLPLSEDALVPVLPPPPPALLLDSDATYVLAGGLGSLGLRIANVMAQSGAKHLTFLSRSGGDRYADRLKQLNEQGCATLVLKCDVVSAEDVDRIVDEVAKTGRAVRGVVQCAMVLQDSLFDKMTFDQWSKAFRPKVQGSWNLHSSLPKDMDFFVMLSSVVSVIGNVSQANYAAGNSYMDALAHYRRSLGLAAVSINAGLVADSDHTIDGTTMDEYLERFSHMASVSTTLQELDIAIVSAMRGVTTDGRATGPQFVFCMSDSLHPDGVDHWARDRKFLHRTAVADSQDSASALESSGPSIGQLLSSAASKHDAQLIVQDALKKLLAPGLGIQPADIDDDRPLYDAGVDSFKAVEIRNQVFRELKSDISVFEILSPSSLAQLAGLVVTRSQLVPTEARETSDG